MSQSNVNVIKIKQKKPRAEELNKILMTRKSGPHKRNKQKVSRKELWEELDA